MVEGALREAGHAVVSAPDLETARNRLAEGGFRVVLLDWMLPDGSGTELIPLMRQMQPETPILVFSEHSMPVEAASQVAAVLSKSRTSLEDLVAAVKKLVAHPERPYAVSPTRTHPAG